ncbi:hypothetical protein [Hydrogenophaga sp.]|uniref:hypothetical protein n=1 Tax=Hydrogenophaga sp. TaxID=1904254 RepID=UPI0027192AAE|nr:hypothetical protein [Hydrogenophaga sp.]MDO9434259.1 hypothetical protein [Hydrogenophaga sp.]
MKSVVGALLDQLIPYFLTQLDVPEGRSSGNGRDLDSLEDPLPTGHDGTLFEVLARKWGQSDLQWMVDAVDAIQMLDTTDDPQAIDEDTCQRAAAMLLDLGQARLLRRLPLSTPLTV